MLVLILQHLPERSCLPLHSQLCDFFAVVKWVLHSYQRILLKLHLVDLHGQLEVHLR